MGLKPHNTRPQEMSLVTVSGDFTEREEKAFEQSVCRSYLERYGETSGMFFFNLICMTTPSPLISICSVIKWVEPASSSCRFSYILNNCCNSTHSGFSILGLMNT